MASDSILSSSACFEVLTLMVDQVKTRIQIVSQYCLV